MNQPLISRKTSSTAGALTQCRWWRVLLSSALLLGLLFLLALLSGSEAITFGQLVGGVWARVTGTASPLTAAQEAILFAVRLPRNLLAVGVGAALALAGAAFQSLLRNPLADPHILGVSSGAAAGSIVGILLAQYWHWELTLMRPACSFVAALLTSLLVYQLGRRDDEQARLVLAGLMVSTFLSALTVLTLALVDDVRLRSITLWLLGDLSGASWLALGVVAMAVITGLIVLLWQAPALNLLMIGEQDAFSLGVEVRRVRWIVFFTAAWLTGAAVAAGGAIGYIGLLAPHVIRLLAGNDNRLVIPASALCGATLGVLADTLARTLLAPRELPTGAITALIGAPLFIYLLLRQPRA